MILGTFRRHFVFYSNNIFSNLGRIGGLCASPRRVGEPQKQAGYRDILVGQSGARHFLFGQRQPYENHIRRAFAKPYQRLKAVMTANFSEDIVCNLHIDECFESYCKHCRKADCRLRREPFVEQLDFDIDIFVKEKAETSPNQTS